MRFKKRVVGQVEGGKVVESVVLNEYGEVIHKEQLYIGDGQLKWLFGDEVEQIGNGVWMRKEDGKIFIDKNMSLDEMLAIIKGDKRKWEIFLELEKMFEQRRKDIKDRNKAYANVYRIAIMHNDLNEARKEYEKILNEIMIKG